MACFGDTAPAGHPRLPKRSNHHDQALMRATAAASGDSSLLGVASSVNDA
jgi:hypothetical protein